MAGPEGEHVILPVDISLSGSSFLAVVSAPNKQPPYRIDNRHPFHPLAFQSYHIQSLLQLLN